MERRKSKRLSHRLNAKVVSSGDTYNGTIENVSEDGIEYLLTSLVDTSKEFTPDKMISLTFETPSGKKIKLSCEVKWFLRSSPKSDKMTLGMQIINPPSEYRNMVDALRKDKSG